MAEPNKTNIIAGLFTAYAFEQLTVSNSVKTLSASKYGVSVKRAVITVESGDLRYRYDNGLPTASVGHRLNRNDVLTLIGSANIQNFRAIRRTSTDSTIMVSYER